MGVGSGTREARDLPGVSAAAFDRWLSETHPGVRGATDSPLQISLIAGGRSNLTYRVDGAARPLVLRRGPLAHALATAHDMGREARVIRALAGSGVPVPEVVVTSPAPVPGVDAPFYLMERVDGLVLRSRKDNAQLRSGLRPHVAFALADTLASLHALDPAAVGLAGLGRPDGYLARQLARWSAQLEASRSRPLPHVERLVSLLGQSRPAHSDAALLHGDFRLDNVIIDPATAGIRAVLDWEMATLGDPLADLALFGFYWDLPRRAPEIARALPSAVDQDDGYPAFEELVERYARARGIERPDLRWYLAFSAFKLAVIAEGIHYRFRLGKTAGGGFDRFGEAVEPIAALGLAELDALTGSR